MFDRKKSRVDVDQEAEFVDAVKYQYSGRPGFPRRSTIVLMDEYFIPSLKIVFNSEAEFRCNEARNIDEGNPFDNKVETVSPLENVKLPKELVDQIEIAVKAREAWECAREKLAASDEYVVMVGLSEKARFGM